MAKQIDDMIVPEKRKSIRDIPIPESRRASEARFTPQFAAKEYNLPPLARENVPPPKETTLKPPPRPSGRKGLWTLIILIVLGVGTFSVLSMLGGSTLAYVPKSANVSFDNETFSAQKSGSGALLFSVVKLSKEKGAEAPATGEEQVSRRASGTIVVYNTGAEPQRLRETTRFETPDGKVYRTPTAIVVPARRTVNGQVQPGSIEATVQADAAGDSHNIDLSDFTLPGLAGTPQFSSVYARSKTPMTGGFVGVERAVSESDKARVRGSLEAALRDELLSEARTQMPEEFVLFPSLSHVSFEELPQTASASTSGAIINLRGYLHAATFKKADLSTHISAGKITLLSGESVDLVPLDSLQLDFSGFEAENLPLADEIRFSVSGAATAVWRTDEVALQTDLLGKHKKDVASILNNYPSIVSATATVRPFWKNSFPQDGGKITIKKIPAN